MRTFWPVRGSAGPGGVGSFFFPSYCLRESKNARYHRWSYEVITIISDTIWQDAITMVLRRAKWTHEVNTKMSLREYFGQFFACQRFCLCSRSCCRSLENTTGGHTMGKDGFANGPMFLRSDPNLNIFIFECPSAFKFGTVLRQN